MWRYCALLLVVLTPLSSGCSSSSITQEETIQEYKAVVRDPNIQFNNPRFYHESQKSLVSIRYRNSGPSHAYRVVTDFKVFLDAHNIPIEEDSIGYEPTLAPKAARELRGILPDTFFEHVLAGKSKLILKYTAAYQNEEGKQFVAVSTWQFSKITMEPFLLEDQIK